MPFIAAAGHRLEYELLEGSAPTLVLLHEGLGSIGQWRDFPQRVADATGCAVLVYARYGYGQSDVLAEERVAVSFMHDEALNSLPDVLAALGIADAVLGGRHLMRPPASLLAEARPGRGPPPPGIDATHQARASP